MTIERLRQIFEEEDSEWEGDNAYQGLQILSKYAEEVVCAASKDVLYSVNAANILDSLSEEDAILLSKLNWMLDTRFGDERFACFV